MSKEKENNRDVTQQIFPSEISHVNNRSGEKRRCLGCMNEYDKNSVICPHCGYSENEKVDSALHLYPGSLLQNRYIIGRTLGSGGFGVTYIAWDPVLQTKVAIKEYLPSEFSTRSSGQSRVTVFSGEKSQQFRDGMDKFIDEAKRLAKFHSEDGIVRIYDSFKENETAYIVMEYLEGETLAKRLERDKQIDADEAITLMMPIIESLSHVHEAGIIHRDIAPDNIFLTNDGKVKLIDFGAARFATTSRSRSLTVIIKPGYSAEEQYRSRGDQGPYTDVYSVGATLYKMITGETPPDALERRAHYEKNHKDILKPISKSTKKISKNQQVAIYNAMNVRIEDRTEDMITLAGELLSTEKVKRRKGTIMVVDLLAWPLWAKIAAPTALVASIVLCVLLGLGIIGPKSGLSMSGEVPDGKTRVPEILGRELDEADKLLDKYDLERVISDKQENENYDKDTVLLQDPDFGNIVSKNSKVNVVISAGKGDEIVVNVENFTKELAVSELEKLGFKVEIKEEYDNNVAPGSVIKQSEKAGTSLEKGSVITLTVSKGKKNIDTSKIVTIPKITGMTFEQAQKELSKNDLYVAINDAVYSNSIPEGQIISQSPSNGDEAHAGDIIGVTVSMGIKKVYVPDVIYRTEQKAIDMLIEKELSSDVVYEENKEVAAGTVFAQSIDSGAEVEAGTVVTLTVSKGYTVTVPDVTGKKADAAQDALSASGLASDIVYQKSSTVAKDRVISQSLSAGSKVEFGTNVTLTVSKGEADVDAGEEEAEPITFSSLSISSQPSKTQYYVGDGFNQSGLKVVATYSDGTTKDVTSKCSVSGFDSSASGSCVVKASYTENGETRTASFTVTIKTPSITLSSTSLSMEYKTNASLTATAQPSGCAISWTNSNINVATVSSVPARSWDANITGLDSGKTTVTASFKYNGKTYSATCAVTVTKTELQKYVISVDRGTGITSVTGGGSFVAGATVTVKATLADGYSWSGWTSSDPSAVPNSTQQVYSFTMPASANPVTLTANATEKVVSGWVKASEAPANAEIVDRKWTYQETSYTESTSSSLSGWTRDTSKTPKTTYGTWSAWTTTKLTESSTVDVDNSGVLYRYYYFGCSCGNRQPYQKTDCTKCGKYVDGSIKEYKWLDTAYSASGSKKYSEYKCVTTKFDGGKKLFFSSGNLNSTKINTKDADPESPGNIVIKQGYRKRSITTTYYYYKVENKESTTYPSGSNISNVTEYVKYR